MNPNGIGEFDSCGDEMYKCPRLQNPKAPQDCRCLIIPKCPALHKLALENKFDEIRQHKRCGFEKGDIKLCCPQDGIKSEDSDYEVNDNTTDQGHARKVNTTDQSPQKDEVEAKTLEERIGEIDGVQELDGICMKDDKSNMEGLSCGLNSIKVRIFGGEDAGSHDYPWAAAIAYKQPKSEKIKYACGGALIHNQYVITAAHCTLHLRGNTLDHVKIGHANLKHPCGVEVGIEGAFPHPNYDPSKNFINDIALLKLGKPVKVGPTINFLCLPSPANENAEDTLEPVVVGWGLTENGTNSDILQELELQVIQNEECTNVYREHFIKRQFSDAQASSFRISKTQICANHTTIGKDSCRGDSGGPLMSRNSLQEWVIHGVVSFGNLNCDSEVPGVYTRVAKYLEWIDSIITREQ